jgi:hypothetical protein
MQPMSDTALSSSVLVLNRQYMAVHVVDVRRAFTLLLRELAEVVHIEDGQYGNYDFESWREISELQSQFMEPHQDCCTTIAFRSSVYDSTAVTCSPVTRIAASTAATRSR